MAGSLGIGKIFENGMNFEIAMNFENGMNFEIGTIFENGTNFQASLQHFQLLSGTCAEMNFCGNSVKSQKFDKLHVSTNCETIKTVAT